MGLINVPAMFMQMINNLFIDILYKGIVVFLDDVLVYSTMAKEHFQLLEKVFAFLCKHELYCMLKNCSFLQKTNTFLEFGITPECLKISDAKLQSLKEWPKPTTIF